MCTLSMCVKLHMNLTSVKLPMNMGTQSRISHKNSDKRQMKIAMHIAQARQMKWVEGASVWLKLNTFTQLATSNVSITQTTELSSCMGKQYLFAGAYMSSVFKLNWLIKTNEKVWPVTWIYQSKMHNAYSLQTFRVCYTVEKFFDEFEPLSESIKYLHIASPATLQLNISFYVLFVSCGTIVADTLQTF